MALLFKRKFLEFLEGKTVKPDLVATSIKQACFRLPKQANALQCACIKQPWKAASLVQDG